MGGLNACVLETIWCIRLPLPAVVALVSTHHTGPDAPISIACVVPVRSVRISFVQSVSRTGTNARGSAQARRYSRTAGTRHGYNITIATIRVIANSYPPYAAGARKIGHEYTRSLQTNGGATLERPFATPPTQHTGRSAFCFCSCSTSRLIPRTFELHLIAIPFSVRAHDAPRAANCDSYAMRHLAAFALSSGDAASRARRCSARIALDAQHSAH